MESSENTNAEAESSENTNAEAESSENTNAEAERRIPVCLTLDIENAFDMVCHNGLWYELMRVNTPASLNGWITSFSQNSHQEIMEITIKYGVLQGSPMSPLTFLFYMFGVDKKH